MAATDFPGFPHDNPSNRIEELENELESFRPLEDYRSDVDVLDWFYECYICVFDPSLDEESAESFRNELKIMFPKATELRMLRELRDLTNHQ